MKTVLINTYRICVCVGIIGIFFTMSACKSRFRSHGEINVVNSELVSLPISIEKRRLKIASITVDDKYTLKFGESIVDIDKGRVNLPGRLEHSERMFFEIVYYDEEGNEKIIDGEALFTYSRVGFGGEGSETAVFYGRSGQDDFPFTISLVPDERFHVFSGKSKRLNHILDVEGTPFFYSRFNAHNTETGFSIYYKDKIIGFVGLIGDIKVFIDPQLEPELYRTTMYTILFLLRYKRYGRFPVNTNIIKGEK